MSTVTARSEALEKTIQQLQRQFGQQVIAAASRLSQAEVLHTGVTALDTALGGGLAVGQISELRALPGHGATSLAMRLIASAQAAGRIGIFMDLADAFDASAAHHAHVDFMRSHFLLVQPPSPTDAFIFVQAVLHARIPGIVIVRPHPQQPLPQLPWSRLKGALASLPLVVVVIQPPASTEIEAAGTRLLLKRVSGDNTVQIRILRHPLGKAGQVVRVPLLPEGSR
ncbi:MAG: hypothetical protein H6670_10950 [Anaerolineaceae bacterium]|nr:hypothetical protein [Anaerolineaceae bacterium]